MNRLFEKISLDPDLSRGLRAATAFFGALLACLQLGQPLAAQFVATTAMNVALTQLRGAYHVRALTLAGMILVLTGSALLGSLVAGNPVGAVLSIGVLAMLSSV
ncbi:MAG: hypothetical protein EOP84_29445, partial [Verrucomicrobiaceae bacterium]